MQKAIHMTCLPCIVQYRIDTLAKTGPWSIQEAPWLKLPNGNGKGNGKNPLFMFCGYDLK